MSCCVLTNKDKAEENPSAGIPENKTGCMNLTDTTAFHNKVSLSPILHFLVYSLRLF